MNAYEYAVKQANQRYALTQWTFSSNTQTQTYVLPDGCRDFICKENNGQNSSWFVSDLNDTAYSVSSLAGERMQGIRLKPGVVMLHTELSQWLKTNSPEDLFNSDQLDEFCNRSTNVLDALNALASDYKDVRCVAKELGVSQRSLQRLIKTNTGRTPVYWLSLARIRRAGRALASCDSLIDIAMCYGFSDQAHMTRDMKKWFGCTPNQIRADKQLLSTMLESGYG